MDSELPAHEKATPPSVAVLPFADLSPDRDQGYFCEGIAEELINALVRIGSLHVAPRIAAFQAALLKIAIAFSFLQLVVPARSSAALTFS